MRVLESSRQSLSFEALCQKVTQSKKRKPFMGTLLALDPGETTGVAIFQEGKLVEAFQESTKEIKSALITIAPIIKRFGFDAIVIEEYRVYAWKVKEHAWSDLHTSRLIGAIELLCAIHEIPLHKQSAQIAKQFCTDKKLKDWNLWLKGQVHSRDAIRHGCYFILFGKYTGDKT